jgi:hypothetical protein
MKRGKPGSSVSIVSGYGLDDWAIEVRSPAEAKWFFLYPMCTMGTGGPFPGDKARPERDTDHSLPASYKVDNE